MEYISQRDYEYVMNKHHQAELGEKGRFRRNDAIFAPDSGLSPDEVMAGLAETVRANEHEPHVICKARALAYVLKNTRIACDTRDIFPAINMIDRPLYATLIWKWKNEVFNEIIPEVGARRAQLERDGIVTIWPDFDHSVPVWERVFSLGFPGLLRESEQARKSKVRTKEEDLFFEGIKVTYEAILAFLDRLYDCAEEGKMKNALDTLRKGAPQSFYEALLLSYLYFILLFQLSLFIRLHTQPIFKCAIGRIHVLQIIIILFFG